MARETTVTYRPTGGQASIVKTDTQGRWQLWRPVGEEFTVEFERWSRLTLDLQGGNRTVDSDPSGATGISPTYKVVSDDARLAHIDAGYADYNLKLTASQNGGEFTYTVTNVGTVTSPTFTLYADCVQSYETFYAGWFTVVVTTKESTWLPAGETSPYRNCADYHAFKMGALKPGESDGIKLIKKDWANTKAAVVIPDPFPIPESIPVAIGNGYTVEDDGVVRWMGGAADTPTDNDAETAPAPGTTAVFSFLDTNGDGLRSGQEPAQPGVHYQLLKSDGTVVAEAVADERGFAALWPNAACAVGEKLTVVAGAPGGLNPTKQDVGSDERSDSDIDQSGRFVITAAADGSWVPVTVGYVTKPVLPQTGAGADAATAACGAVLTLGGGLLLLARRRPTVSAGSSANHR